MSFAMSDGGHSVSQPLNENSCSSQDIFSGDSKIQQAIQVVQRNAAHIRKEACLLKGAQKYTSNKQSMLELEQEARLATQEARCLLHKLALDVGGSRAELNLRRLKHQKLSENLQSSIDDLEESWRTYQSAEAGQASQQLVAEEENASVVMLHPSSSSSSARDLECGQLRVQQQQIDTVCTAELDMHAAIAAEYSHEMTTLARNVNGMQQALLDIARITESQGEMLDNIETSMMSASHNTETAVEQLQKANNYQQRGMKWILRLMCVIILLIVAMVTYVAHGH